MIDSANLNILNAQQTPAAIAAGFILSAGDGKGVTVPDNHRMVKISEKKAGKGKGKTVSFCIIPVIAASEYQENFTAVIPMLNELCEELQRDIATRMQRDGIKAVCASDIGIPACILEWTNRTFSVETVGAWFDAEVSDLLALQILTAKGWNAESLNAEQMRYLETKAAAYRASYVETASKFPGLNPSQCSELARVIELLELTGPIVSRIKDKIVPKETNSSLGF
jgi:hypothetical protein